MSFESPEEMEEERRLFYVAITRARKRVFISYAQNRYRWGTPTSTQPSRFLRDIDPKFLDLPAEPTDTVYKNHDYEENDWDSDFQVIRQNILTTGIQNHSPATQRKNHPQ